MIARASLADGVAVDLRRQIQRSGFAGGDRIPTEGELVTRYGVSRTVIREALAQLRCEGLVETRQGAGMFVAARRGGTFRLFGGGRAQRLREAFELRLGIEVAAAGLAAERRTSEDLRLLRDALSGMAELSGRVDADRAFHAGLAVATRNNLYASFVTFLHGELEGAIRTAVENTARYRAGEIEAVREEHQRIFEAIEARMPAEAQLAMAAHLARAVERLGLTDVAMPPLQPRAAARAAPLPGKPRPATATRKARPPTRMRGRP